MKEREIEAVVADLQQVDRRAGWRRVLLIGEIIVRRVYGGDREACRQPKRRALSIRRIAQHPNCPFRKSRLAESIGVYLLWQDMPRVRACHHVGPSHVAAVLPLAPERQGALLEQAEHERWSVRRLREAVVELRRVGGERRGRPRRDPQDCGQLEVGQAVQALERAAAQLEAAGSDPALLARVRQALSLLLVELGSAPERGAGQAVAARSDHRGLGHRPRVA